ncbi:M55 family metallopeptidase, partial [Kibdelosporangium lantanae]
CFASRITSGSTDTDPDGVVFLGYHAAAGADGVLAHTYLETSITGVPPDADARAAILKSSSRNTPLAADVSLDEVAKSLDGYSAADCAALIREAALTAMRESLEAREVTGAHLTKAREAVRPSLDPAQLASLEAYAKSR